MAGERRETMATRKKKVRRGRSRPPLSRERVLEKALELADREGLEALSMRRLGEQLGVEAMSLYNHVAGKDEILDGMVDLVVSEIGRPTGSDWKVALRDRALRAREVLLRHPWAPAVIESRLTPSPARLESCEAVAALLLDAGFPASLAHRAFVVLDSYIYGFTLQEFSWPFEVEEMGEVVAELGSRIPRDEFPALTEMMGHLREPRPEGSQGFRDDFEFGLDLVLDGLERTLERS